MTLISIRAFTIIWWRIWDAFVMGTREGWSIPKANFRYERNAWRIIKNTLLWS